jgi:radical SAM superfamily enzyme YgiQ (UPF0313 family)
MIGPKILILNPYFREIDNKKLIFPLPLFVHNVGSLLRYNDFDVQIRKFSLYKKSFDNDILYIMENKFEYIFIIFDTELYMYDISLFYSEKIKNLLPNCKIVIFHKLNNEITYDLINKKYIDIVAHGEEDFIALDIAKGKNLKDIDGISYKDNTGNIIHNKPRDLVDDLELDNLPDSRFAYETAPIDYYPEMWVSCSRGRPSNCFYYAPDEKIRYRSPELVVEEIKYLTTKYNIKDLNFCDDAFTYNKEYVYNLMEYFDKYNINIRWYCSTRINTVDYNLLKCMYDHGCAVIIYNIESSLSKNILSFMQHGMTLEEVEKTILITKKVPNIKINLHIKIGNPGESIKTIMDTVNFCIKLKPLNVVDFDVTVPIPGSPYYNYCNENNLLLTKDWSKYDYNNQIIKLDTISNIFKYINIGDNLVDVGYYNTIFHD